jgi:hypothetical protein
MDEQGTGHAGSAPVEEMDPLTRLRDDDEALRLQRRIRIGDGGR